MPVQHAIRRGPRGVVVLNLTHLVTRQIITPSPLDVREPIIHVAVDELRASIVGVGVGVLAREKDPSAVERKAPRYRAIPRASARRLGSFVAA